MFKMIDYVINVLIMPTYTTLSFQFHWKVMQIKVVYTQNVFQVSSNLPKHYPELYAPKQKMMRIKNTAD